MSEIVSELDNNQNDYYTPVKPNGYYFKGHLYQTYDEYLETHRNVVIEKCNLCAYRVVNDSKYPFLQYLLYNQFQNLYFLSMSNSEVDNNIIPNKCKQYLINILQLSNNSYINQPTAIEYKGFHIFNGEMFVFFDITECKLVLNDININNKLWFVLIDEIINYGKVLDINIDPDVTDFLSMNSDVIFLYDADDKRYEVPSVAYITAPENKTQFVYTFGVSSSTNSIFGPYYYFTNYENCLKRKNNNNNGLIRFALFFESTKYVDNSTLNYIDESEIKREKLRDDGCDSQYERLTMSISDYDGKWSKHYNSIMLGNIKLDNGKMLEDIPIYCVKEYEQQYPLSYHFI